jgi:hypothetical protein
VSYIMIRRPLEGRAEDPSCRSYFNHLIRVLTANSSKDTKARLDGLLGCDDTIGGQDGLGWAGHNRVAVGFSCGRGPRVGLVPRPTLGYLRITPLALEGLWERATATSPPRLFGGDGRFSTADAGAFAYLAAW